MNTKNLIIGVLVVVVLVFAGLYFTNPVFLGAGSGPAHYQNESFLQGLAAGARDQFSVSNVGALTSSGANVLSGTLTQSGAAVFSGNTSVVQSASSSLYVGGANNTGCIVLGDSSAPTSTNRVYITATGATISATTTKPQICR